VNILFCTLSYYPGITGGAERQARLQAEELVRRGHRVTVVCARTDNLASGEIGGVRIVRLRRIDRRPMVRVSYLARLLAWLVRHGRAYDVVHVHLANVQADIAVLTAHFHGRPCYVKVACGGTVGEVQRLRRTARILRWYGLRHADRVQALSTEIRAELATIGVPEKRMIELPNGVCLAEYRPISAIERRRLRKELRLPERAVIALFVGRLVDYKGIHDLLAAWPRVGRKDARLLIVGATDDQVIDAPPGVIVRGWADSPLPYLRAAEVFVHPSHADGMSNAVLEALACGCALIATEHGATDGFLSAGRDALLVPVRDPPALASALQQLLQDADLRAKLTSNARETVHRYAISNIVTQIEDEYLTMLAERGVVDFAPRIDHVVTAEATAVSEVGAPR
jgi:L-malate glycosyltransferase